MKKERNFNLQYMFRRASERSLNTKKSYYSCGTSSRLHKLQEFPFKFEVMGHLISISHEKQVNIRYQ